jgi:hypothetical protein
LHHSLSKFLLLNVLLLAPAQALDLTLPNSKLTPGVTRSLSRATICNTRWGLDKRFVTTKMKLGIYHEYGLSGPKDKRCLLDAHGRRCEIDHLIPRSLGGADKIANLWPQPYGSKPWNASRKDRLEVKLGREYCAGRLSLITARHMLVRDYRIAYRKYFGNP